MVFGSINYWEGPTKVSGLFKGRKVKGQGFMELVGYPSEYSNATMIANEIRAVIDGQIELSKNKINTKIAGLKKKWF